MEFAAKYPNSVRDHAKTTGEKEIPSIFIAPTHMTLINDKIDSNMTGSADRYDQSRAGLCFYAPPGARGRWAS